MYNFSQEQIFIFFFIIGIIIGMIFDIFRVIRKSFRSPDIITFVEDIIFLLITSSLLIYSIIKLNGGEIRFYLFLAIFFRYIDIFFDNKQLLCYNFIWICKNM